MSANLWGQEPEPIDLSTCTIEGVAPYYHYTGNAITVTPVVKNGETIVDPDYYNVSYTYDGNDLEGNIVDKGTYELIVSGKESYTTGEKRYTFYVYGALLGLGTEENPYQIGSAADWNEFATHTLYWEGYVIMTDNVPNTTDISNGITYVSAVIGTDWEGFSGTFDGASFTLKFSGNGMYGVAPFYDTYGATIKNLKVEGNIVVNAGWSAGLIYENYGETTIENVTVSVNITDGNNGSAGGHCAGFAAWNRDYEGESGVLIFSNCVFNGKIIADDNSGGFIGSHDQQATFTNCLFNPAEGSDIEDGENFGIGTIGDNCYYTMKVGSSDQGAMAYKNDAIIPDGEIVKTVTINTITVKGCVAVETNVKDLYAYTGSTILSTPEVSFDGVDAIANGYCTAEISPSPVQAVGTYTLTITPDNTKGYYGSYTKTFKVAKLNGDGSSEHPYEIASTDDWNCLAVYVNDNGESFSGKYVHLTNDITVSTMVGTPEHPFSGDFSGLKGEYAANTLTFNYGTSANPTTDEIVAPFRYTDGATIHSLIVDGAIYTNVGKESGLIGVNTRTSNTTVQFVINRVNFICYEDLLDAEGGGYAYDGSGISFYYSSYEGTISANNYHGGFCGNANASTTSFSNCLFNPTESGFYWAQNFVFNATDLPDNYNTTYYSTCYYTLGHNQEESDQGTMVFVNSVPEGNIGHKLTTFHEKVVYEPVTVVISGVNKRYTYTGNDITITPTVTFNGTNALTNNYCEWSITQFDSPSYPMHDVGQYTFTLTAPKTGATGEAANYLGTINQIIRVVNAESSDWAALQAQLSGLEATINLKDLTNEAIITAGDKDACLVVENGRNVTINLNGKTIDRGFYESEGHWRTPVVGGQVLKIASGATVIINGPGTIMGGCNKASSNTEHAENSDAGGIYNMGTLTLNNVTIEGNYCEKKDAGVYRTARGGGIYSGSKSELIIKNCTITHNEAKGGGGGIYAEKAAVFMMMDNTIVQSNVSQDKGGGIRVNAEGTKHYDGESLVAHALIKDCDINSNTVELHNPQSASNGGGIHLDAGIVDMINCSIIRNRSSKYGGGIYMMGGTINADNCSIKSNSSYDEVNYFEGCGGGVCLLGGTFKMNGGIVTNNSSYISDGGGIYVAAGKTLKLEGSVNIYDNWTVEDEYLSNKHTTNVYLAGANDKITISASIAEASVGVSKNGGAGRFTSGLNDKGTTANFVSDYAAYQVLPDGGEAKLGVPAEMPSDVDDLHLPDGIEKVGDEYVVKVPFTVDQPVVILRSVRFEEDGCIIITENGILRVPSITNSDPLKIIIDDGGQIIFTGTPGSVAARVKKEVKEFSSTKPIDNWYLISSPVSSPVVSTATNIVVLDPEMVEPTPGYDLYRFNEAATATNEQGQILHWENYRNTTGSMGHADFTTLANGRGYLYRSCQDYTVTADGNLNVGEVESYTLTNSSTDVLKGFNVIGNPYPHNIKKGDGQAIPNTYLEDKYYVLNPTGCVWDLKTDAEEIPPFTGILVQAKSDVSATQTLTISDVTISSSKSAGYEKANNANIWFTVANSKYEDKACVEFKEGHGLNKIAHINEEAPMLYINYNGEDFASVDMNPGTRYFSLNFEAKTTGMYTLSVQPQGDYSYLHLYDKLTGKDVDLLLDNEYSFVGSTTDAADRFTIMLNPSTSAGSENEIFAYQSGNDIIVNGNGELQVFDVMGRMVMQQHVNGVQTICTSSLQTGVYIFKLNEMTQKIVVR